jgi:ribosome-associated protein
VLASSGRIALLSGADKRKDLGPDPYAASLRFADVDGVGLSHPDAVQSNQRRSAPLTAKRTTRSTRVKATAKKPAKRKAVAKKTAPTKKPAKAKVEKPLKRAPEASQKLLDLVLKTLDADKAEDVIAIDLSNKSPMADFMVIASGRSNRHVAAVAEHLTEALKSHGYRGRAEGLPQGDWVLVDAMDVIVHIFRPEVRAFYNLEKMWNGGAAMAEAV